MSDGFSSVLVAIVEVCAVVIVVAVAVMMVAAVITFLRVLAEKND